MSRDGPRNSLREMERGFKAGALGMKVFKSLGQTITNSDGSFIQCDDPRLDPIWAMAAKYDRPVMIHTGDSIGRFYPIGPKNERYEAGLWRRPGDTSENLYRDGPKQDVIERARENMHRKHPKTRFVNAHLAMLYYDPQKLAAFLDTYPNANVEISATLQDLGRAPRLWREFLIKYQDRTLMDPTDRRTAEPTNSGARTGGIRNLRRVIRTTRRRFALPAGRLVTAAGTSRESVCPMRCCGRSTTRTRCGTFHRCGRQSNGSSRRADADRGAVSCPSDRAAYLCPAEPPPFPEPDCQAVGSSPLMRSRLSFATAMLVTGLVAWTAAQKPSRDYTQWRGQARDGSASAFAEPKAWPEMLTRRWRTDVGLGYATPLVVGDRLYVFSRRGDNEVMSALDAATGKTIWETPTPVSFTMNTGAARHGQDRIDAGRRRRKPFAIGTDRCDSAYDATTGKELCESRARSRCRCSRNARVLADRRSRAGDLSTREGDNKGAITAFDVNTGATKWSWTAMDRATARPSSWISAARGSSSR